MKKITKFEANDGAEFTDERKCAEHETLCFRINRVMAALPDGKPEHDEWVQHNRGVLLGVKRVLFKIVLEQHGESWPAWKARDADDVRPMSIVLRVLDDCGGPLSVAWGKLASYDFDTGRQYSQPYFVIHPKEAKEREDNATN